MAEWCHLPQDLLREIQTHITSPFYTVRFRSICSSWRNAIQSNNHNHFPNSISLLFTKRSILLLSPPPTPNSSKPISWIIKIEEISPQSFNLYYPLSKTRVNPLINRFPRVLDVLNTRINELGLEFCYNGSEILGDCSLYTEKVAFLPVKNDDEDEDDQAVKYHCGGVYNLEDASISFAEVFWPPPSWVTSSS